MGDNGIAADPPAKKRVASRQLCKDDGSDSETEAVPQEAGGSFRKASDAVLATRRIVKVRRSASQAPPAPNPFAGIRLAPPSNAVDFPPTSSAPDAPNSPQSVDSVEAESASHLQGTEMKSIDASQNDTKVRTQTEILEELQNNKLDVAPLEGEAAEDATAVKQEEQKVEAEKLAANSGGEGLANLSDDTNEEHKVEQNETPGDLKEEQVQDPAPQSGAGVEEDEEKVGDPSDQIESGAAAADKRAFSNSLGSFATGFSNSSFSFGTAPSSFGTPTGFASFRSSWAFGSSSASGSNSGSAFALKGEGEGGLSTPSTSFASSNGGTFQLFSSQPSGMSSVAPVSASVQSSRAFQEVSVETGEEQEKVAFSADATLFEFADGGWKERGKGELKVNISEGTVGKSRLVMRSKGNYRLLLNASLFPDMKMTSMESRGVTFVCVNSAADGKNGMTTYAVKLKDSLSAASFREAVDTYKGKSHADLKTPENSPRAPHDSGRDAEGTEL